MIILTQNNWNENLSCISLQCVFHGIRLLRLGILLVGRQEIPGSNRWIGAFIFITRYNEILNYTDYCTKLNNLYKCIHYFESFTTYNLPISIRSSATSSGSLNIIPSSSSSSDNSAKSYITYHKVSTTDLLALASMKNAAKCDK